jgi:hypothetical protein
VSVTTLYDANRSRARFKRQAEGGMTDDRMARAHGLTGAIIGYGVVCVAGTLLAALVMTAFALG